jgi:hypothetical protein
MISRSVRFLVALGKAGQSLRLRLHSGLRQSGIPPIAQRAARWMGHPADLGFFALEDADEVADFGIILILPQLPILED